jgi:hypothetical protein
MLADLLPKLVDHLIAANRLDDAANLFRRDAWLQLRAQVHGYEHLLDDARLVIGRALDCDRADIVVRVVLSVDRIAQDSAASWHSGLAAVRLRASTTPDQVLGLVRALGDHQLPFSGFLGVLRLLDLNAKAAARRLLGDLAKRGWPAYVPKLSATGLIGWSDLDTDPLVYFLRHAVSASPQQAASIVRRMYDGADASIVPNRYTLWAALLEELTLRRAPAAQIVGAVDATESEILPGRTVLGYQRLFEARLKAIERVSHEVDPTWLGQHLHLTLTMFEMFRFAESKQSLFFSVMAPLIEHVTVLGQLVLNPTLSTILREAETVLRDRLDTMPERPRTAAYDDRSLVLARFSKALHSLRHGGARQATLIALEACELDSSTNDVPRVAIREALGILEDISDIDARARIDEVRSRLGADDADSTLVSAPWLPTADAADPFERGLAILAGGDLGTSSEGPSEEPQEAMTDCVWRALSTAWPHVGLTLASERTKVIEQKRSVASRELYEHDDAAEVCVIARRMTERGEQSAAAQLLTQRIDASLERNELTAALVLLTRLAPLDPQAAEARLKPFQREDPVTAGSAVAAIIGRLLRDSPRGRLPEAARWIRHVPRHRGQITEDEGFLLRWGGWCPDLTAILERISRRALRDIEQHLRVLLLTRGLEGEEKRSRWGHVAELLLLVAGFEGASPGLRTAYLTLLDQTVQTLQHTRSDVSTLLQPLGEVSIQIAAQETADFYHRLAVEKDSLADSSLSKLDTQLQLATALWSCRPDGARMLAQAAFEEAHRRFGTIKHADSVTQRVANTVIETMFQAVRQTTSGRFFAGEFVKAAMQWADQAQALEVVDELEALASEALEESVGHLLLAGAAAVSVQLGAGDKALSLIVQVPSAALESIGLLDVVDVDRLPATLSRAILKELISRDISVSDFFSDTLTKVFHLNVSIRLPQDAVSMLDAVEKSVRSTD